MHAELLAEAIRIHDEDRRLCRDIGVAGKPFSHRLELAANLGTGVIAAGRVRTTYRPSLVA